MRILLVSLIALLVLGTGVALQPRATEQSAPSFSETARTHALGDALALVDSARSLETTGGANELADAVELLTSHARALQGPGDLQSPGVLQPTTASPVDSTKAADPEAPDPEAPIARKRDELLSSLAASSSRRLADAAASDGGTARLLAAVGTAQFLQATRLAAEWGLKAPAVAVPDGQAAEAPAVQAEDGPRTAERSPAAAASSSGERSPVAGASSPGCPAEGTEARPGNGAPSEAPTRAASTLPRALAAAVRAELEAVYAYQVALTRLEPGRAASASAHLAKHQETLRQAEANSRLLCVDVPPREAGYRLPATFATAPARALGSLEADMLPVYGDLIAMSPSDTQGPSGTRSWAISMLVSAAQRVQSWAEPTGAFPGIFLDTSELPTLQSPAVSPSPGTASRAG